MKEILIKKLDAANFNIDFYKRELAKAEATKEVVEDLLHELEVKETETVGTVEETQVIL